MGESEPFRELKNEPPITKLIPTGLLAECRHASILTILTVWIFLCRKWPRTVPPLDPHPRFQQLKSLDAVRFPVVSNPAPVDMGLRTWTSRGSHNRRSFIPRAES